MDFRCSVASENDDEPLAGTAPTDERWLMVEDPRPWAPQVALDPGPAWAGHRVQLIRRHGGAGAEPGVRVFSAVLGDDGFDVRTAVVDDLDAVAALEPDDLTSYDGRLWLVCTNGRRDLCCAERGRPVAAALADRWPEETWETTHLGGHRFAATLLALPSGVTLGRLDPESAVAACAELETGVVPLDLVRGRAGWPPETQFADLHLRRRFELTRLGQVSRDEAERVEVVAVAGPARRQSCGDDTAKPSWVLTVVQ